MRISDWSSDVCSSDLARDDDAETAADPLSETADIAAADDELVLGSDTIVPEAPKSDGAADTVATERPNNRRRWLSAGSAAGESVATASEGSSPVVEKGEAATSPGLKVKLGGAMFARMVSVRRGTHGGGAADDRTIGRRVRKRGGSNESVAGQPINQTQK